MRQKGVTLIELMIGMVITALLGAGVYRTFVGQQHTYEVQDQVVDVQQNVRMAISRVVRDVRMAGFGRITSEATGPDGMHGQYKNIVNPNGISGVTVVAAYQQVGTLLADAGSGATTIQISCPGVFDGNGPKQYICINGTESHRVKKVDGNTVEFFSDNGNGNSGGGKVYDNHYAGEPIFMVEALTFSIGTSDGKTCLLRDDNLGGGPQPVAENIESLQFSYTVKNADGTLTVYSNVPGNLLDQIRIVQVTIVAKTDQKDPQLSNVGDGYRRRTLTSRIQLRNLTYM